MSSRELEYWLLCIYCIMVVLSVLLGVLCTLWFPKFKKYFKKKLLKLKEWFNG